MGRSHVVSSTRYTIRAVGLLKLSPELSPRLVTIGQNEATWGKTPASLQVASCAHFGRLCSTRRDGRVVDGGGLENHCARKGTGGSNPSPSAKSMSYEHE